MSTPRTEPLLDASIRVDHLPPEGRNIDVLATPAQLLAIAGQLGIGTVERLEARLTLTRFRGGLRAHGQLEAVTVQPCVVTFAPVRQVIDETVERIFLPDADRPKTATTHTEVFVDLEGDDIPDYFEGHEVDLADALVETVALALDPYPRADGAEIAAEDLPDIAEESPFSALKTLLGQDDDR